MKASKPSSVQVSLRLPFLEVAGVWEPDEAERNAAWEMYVELVTRVTLVELREGEGHLREALTSLFSLFGVTREILRRYGPVVAQPGRDGELSFGAIALAVLNDGVRPVLTKWHAELSAHESARPTSLSPTAHELAWASNADLRADLHELRLQLRGYAEALAQAAGVSTQIYATKPSPPVSHG